MPRWIPNALTITRLILVPFVLRFIAIRDYRAALSLCALAAATDALDGYLARRFKAASRTGAYLDPIADKLLLSGAYLVLGLNGTIPLWLTAIVFGRDILILLFVGYAYAFTSIRDFPPSVWGKLSTIVQAFAVLIVLTSPGPLLARVAIGAVTAATLWSAAHYTLIGVRMLSARRT